VEDGERRCCGSNVKSMKSVTSRSDDAVLSLPFPAWSAVSVILNILYFRFLVSSASKQRMPQHASFHKLIFHKVY